MCDLLELLLNLQEDLHVSVDLARRGKVEAATIVISEGGEEVQGGE